MKLFGKLDRCYREEDEVMRGDFICRDEGRVCIECFWDRGEVFELFIVRGS